MLRYALSYARGNCPVFPLSRTSKAPLTRHGFKDATTEAWQIAEWWNTWPDANIGLRCDWFWVLDIDPRNGGDIDRLIATLGDGELAETWTVATGSGGEHFYFAHDSRFDSIPLGKWLDGIDVKGGGRGYVVAPPSIHPATGEPYRWVVKPSEMELPAAPEWLVKRIVRDKAPPPAAPVDTSRFANSDRFEQARRYAAHFDPAISGSGGHSHTFRVCGVLVKQFALSDDEAYSILSEWNSRCVPPWSERELRRKIREARRYSNMAEGAKLR